MIAVKTKSLEREFRDEPSQFVISSSTGLNWFLGSSLKQYVGFVKSIHMH